ncbi:MAG: hypothetical protein DHS20C05_07990 [Hyphococcus sp.]|nr:MAG: hypothetical protein DHS20C05_07990 [Marinicaulis sp.]
MVEVSVRPITDKATFVSAWADLYERASATSFFLSPAWMGAWIECAAPIAKLYCAEGIEEGRVKAQGIFGEPLGRHAITSLREIRLHETGNTQLDNIYIEENDFLISDDAGSDVRKAMLAAAAAHFARYDSIVFRNTMPQLADALETWSKGKDEWVYKEIAAQSDYRVDLTDADDGDGLLLASFSSSLRANIRRSIRLYEARGPLSIKIAASPEEKASAWSKLIDLHEARWRQQGQSGVFANDHLMKFHESLQKMAPEKISLAEVFCGNDVVGVLYNFLHEGAVINYQTGFKMEDDNKLKPGLLSHALACDHYRKQGFKQYDFLAGDDEYKRKFGKETHQLKTIALERRSLRMKARNFLKALR